MLFFFVFIIMKRLFLLFLTLFFIGCIKPDSIPGSIEGKTMDASESKVSNVKLWIKTDKVIDTTFSNSIGYYKFENILPAKYQVWAWKEEYDTTVYTEVEVFEADTTIRDVKLYFKSY